MAYIKIIAVVIYTFLCSLFALIFGILRSYNLYFKLSRIFSGGLLLIAGVKLKISGLENIDKDGIYVFVSNHASQYDIMTVQYAVPVRTSIIYKRELNNIPLFGWQLALGPYISIDRKNAERAARTISRAKSVMVKNKMSVLLFPEGTRSSTGEIQAFKRGAFNLAVKVNYPIIPVTIKGSNKILPKNSFRIKSGEILVHFGEPIDVSTVKDRQSEIALMNKVKEVISLNYGRL